MTPAKPDQGVPSTTRARLRAAALGAVGALLVPLPAAAAPAPCGQTLRYAAQSGTQLMRIADLNLGPAGRDDEPIKDLGLGEVKSALVAQSPINAAALGRMLDGGPANRKALTEVLRQNAPPNHRKPEQRRYKATQAGPFRLGKSELTVRARWDPRMACGSMAGEATRAEAELRRAGVLEGGDGSLVRVPGKISGLSTTAMEQRGPAARAVAAASMAGRKVELLGGAIKIKILKPPSLLASMSGTAGGEVRYKPAVLEVSGDGFETARLDTAGDNVEFRLDEDGDPDVEDNKADAGPAGARVGGDSETDTGQDEAVDGEGNDSDAGRAGTAVGKGTDRDAGPAGAPAGGDSETDAGQDEAADGKDHDSDARLAGTGVGRGTDRDAGPASTLAGKGTDRDAGLADTPIGKGTDPDIAPVSVPVGAPAGKGNKTDAGLAGGDGEIDAGRGGADGGTPERDTTMGGAGQTPTAGTGSASNDNVPPPVSNPDKNGARGDHGESEGGPFGGLPKVGAVGSAGPLPLPSIPGVPPLGTEPRTEAAPVAGPGTIVKISLGDVRQAVFGHAIAAKATAMTIAIAKNPQPSSADASNGFLLDLDMGLLEVAAVAPEPAGGVSAAGGVSPTASGRGGGLPITGPRVDIVALTGLALLIAGAAALIFAMRGRPRP